MPAPRKRPAFRDSIACSPFFPTTYAPVFDGVDCPDNAERLAFELRPLDVTALYRRRLRLHSALDRHPKGVRWVAVTIVLESIFNACSTGTGKPRSHQREFYKTESNKRFWGGNARRRVFGLENFVWLSLGLLVCASPVAAQRAPQTPAAPGAEASAGSRSSDLAIGSSTIVGSDQRKSG